MIEVVVEELKMILVEKIERTRGKDKEVVRIVEEMKRVGIKNLRGDKWEIEKDLVLKEEKMYMLKIEELRMEII